MVFALDVDGDIDGVATAFALGIDGDDFELGVFANTDELVDAGNSYIGIGGVYGGADSVGECLVAGVGDFRVDAYGERGGEVELREFEGNGGFPVGVELCLTIAVRTAAVGLVFVVSEVVTSVP